MAIEDPLCEEGNYYDMVNQVKLSPTQALSAAAAIGNLRAVEHFVEKGGEILSTTAHNGVYDRPMSAAATTGQLAVLGFCIEYFERAVCRLPPNISDLEKVLDRSIKDVIKAANREALALLLDCYQRNARFFPAAVHDKIGRYSVFWTWFTDASRFGCVNTFTTLITKIESMNKRLGHEELRSAYSSACMHGHTELVQYLLQNNMVHVNAFGNPLRTAIEYSHRGVALVLLKHGADIHDHKLLRMALCGDKSTKFLLVKFLLDNGYLVTQNDLQALRKSIFFDPYKHLSVDENMALVLLSQEIKKRMDLSRADVAYQMVDQLRGIKDGIWPVPREPMPFRQIAHEVFEWVHSLPGSPQVEQRAERGGTSRRRSSKTTPKSIWD
jgi:ankyrin repeat protein